MRTGCAKITALPAGENTKETTALECDEVFRELHELEAMTGRTGLSARVRVGILDILQSADKIAQEKALSGKRNGRVRR